MTQPARPQIHLNIHEPARQSYKVVKINGQYYRMYLRRAHQNVSATNEQFERVHKEAMQYVGPRSLPQNLFQMTVKSTGEIALRTQDNPGHLDRYIPQHLEMPIRPKRNISYHEINEDTALISTIFQQVFRQPDYYPEPAHTEPESDVDSISARELGNSPSHRGNRSNEQQATSEQATSNVRPSVDNVRPSVDSGDEKEGKYNNSDRPDSDAADHTTPGAHDPLLD